MFNWHINYLLLAAFCLGQLAHAEEPPEGLDFVGGYFEDGIYKCYREPCFQLHSNQYPTENNRRFRPKTWVYWLDVDRNCQKEDIQAIVNASLTPVLHEEDNPCLPVKQGRWQDAYSGKVISDVSDITVDWLVSLQEAHLQGGFAWKRNKRALFANMSSNLIVVSKSQKDARAQRSVLEWMPSDKAFWCDYIVKREQVFRQFSLTLSSEEQAFNREIKRLYCKF